MAESIASLADRRREKTRARAQALMASLSPEDLHTLQHDVLSRPGPSRIPSSLRGLFHEWLSDAYGPIERETRMAPENQGETEGAFLQEAAEQDDDPGLAAQAQFILEGAALKMLPDRRCDCDPESAPV